MPAFLFVGHFPHYAGHKKLRLFRRSGCFGPNNYLDIIRTTNQDL